MGSGISGLRLRGGEGLGGTPVEVMFGAGGVKVQVPAGQAEQRKMRGGVARGLVGRVLAGVRDRPLCDRVRHPRGRTFQVGFTLRISDRAVTTDEAVQAWAVGGQHPGEHPCESTDGKEPATEAGKEQGGKRESPESLPGSRIRMRIREGCLEKEAGWSVNMG